MNKKILLVSGLVFLLLPSARVFAFDDANRTYSVNNRVQELEEKAKASDAKMSQE
jgi:hypothetical protein